MGVILSSPRRVSGKESIEPGWGGQESDNLAGKETLEEGRPMQCPKCGYELQPLEETCPRCARIGEPPTPPLQGPAPPLQGPAPVPPQARPAGPSPVPVPEEVLEKRLYISGAKLGALTGAIAFVLWVLIDLLLFHGRESARLGPILTLLAGGAFGACYGAVVGLALVEYPAPALGVIAGIAPFMFARAGMFVGLIYGLIFGTVIGNLIPARVKKWEKM